jgi:hypothetical protein
MSDATAAMNDATSGERVRNQQRHRLPEQRPRRNRQPTLAGSHAPRFEISAGQSPSVVSLRRADRACRGEKAPHASPNYGAAA